MNKNRNLLSLYSFCACRLMLFLACTLGFAIANSADADQITWRFESVAGTDIPGNDPDVGFNQRVTYCVPIQRRFITRKPRVGDPFFDPRVLKTGEHILPETFMARKVSSNTLNCQFAIDKSTQPTPQCPEVSFSVQISPGSGGASACDGLFELYVQTDKDN